MQHKILNIILIFQIICIVSSCKKVTQADSTGQSTIKYLCQCETHLGGYMRASKLGDCNCESRAGVLGCVLYLECSSEEENKKNEIEFYIGDKHKWDELIEFFNSQDDPIAKNLSINAKIVYEKGVKEGKNPDVLFLLEKLNSEVEKLSAITKMKLRMSL